MKGVVGATARARFYPLPGRSQGWIHVLFTRRAGFFAPRSRLLPGDLVGVLGSM